MPAANTDKLKYLSRRWVGQIGAGGVADNSTTTIPLASTTNLPTATAVVVVVDRVDNNGTATPTLEETVIGVVSGSNLVSCVRGSEGTAQAHNAGAVVEVLVTAKGWNDMVDGILQDHTQLGYHESLTDANGVTWIGQDAVASAVNRINIGNAITAVNPTIVASGTDANIGITIRPKGTGTVAVDSPLNYAADGGSTDTYAVTIKGIASLTTGLMVNFKANTANTGAATLNVNSLGAITIKKLRDQDLATGDIEANQIVTLMYDGTNFQMQSQVASSAASGVTSKVIASTRDMTAGTGSVAYTGVGFTPSTIHNQSHIEGTKFPSWGFSDSALGQMSTNLRSDANWYGNSDKFITIDTAAGAQQVGVISAYGADGFTIDWTKANSPTGTLQLYFLCYK